ncbi:MAG TPA: transporter [Candidatus Polarisedimenticolaceae bacterium]
MFPTRALLILAFFAPIAAAGDGPIQDNSFLVEEAYNQETRVVQHISNWTRDDDSGDWAYTFTQEWPVRSQKHQLGFTLPYVHLEDRNGVGDLFVNWRYQAVGSGETPVAFAPRLSLLLPTGDDDRGRGSGELGAQVNLPLSVTLGKRFVSHLNAGATIVADLDTWNAGASLIWLARPRFNVMLESSYVEGDEDAIFLVSPGVRWSHDLKSGLQIVPGIAAPIGVGASSGARSIFLYVSFEHPY